MAETEHPNLAVMFTDIKGYAAIMSEDEGLALALLEKHNHIMESVIDAHDGKIVKNLGDAYMVIFDDGDAAVKCGLHALSRTAARQRDGSETFEIRIGIHEGAMIERGGDFFGEHVNIAARLEQLARPMTIAATERVVQSIAGRVKAEARFVSAQLLKHIRYPVSVYELSPADAWRLYLGPEGGTPTEESADLLADFESAEEAWKQVEGLVHEGNLQQATHLGEAALSRFGGSYASYAHLAGLYLIAGLELEAEAAIKRGSMLGLKGDDDERYAWLQSLVRRGLETIKQSPQELDDWYGQAREFIAKAPDDLAMRVLIEGIKARASSNAEDLAALVQQHPGCALVLRAHAEALKDLGRMSDAHSMLEQTIVVAPEVVDHQLRRVEWMVDGEDVGAVLTETEQLAARFPKEPSVYEWTGKTRLLSLDPCGAQWIFEQGKESGAARQIDSMGWLITSLMQQGRFEQAVDAARREMRSAIRQNRQRMARIYFKMATVGIYLQHWDGIPEILEEYKRYDPEWLIPQTATLAAKQTRKLIPWDRALGQLQEMADSRGQGEFPHASGWVFRALLPAAQDADQWIQLHQLEFYRGHRDWLLRSRNTEATLALEVRGALRFDALETWHQQVVPVLTRLRSRLDHRQPSFLALAGLTRVRLNNFEGGRPYLEQARKLWRNADWPVWEIQEAESVLAAGAATVGGDE